MTCSVANCENPVFCRSLCQKHYARLLRHGSPTGGSTEHGAILDWIKSNMHSWGDECMYYPGYNKEDRLRFQIGDKRFFAARWVCIQVHGDPPSKFHEAAHECGNGHLSCVNPKHLRWATKLENQEDKFRHGRQVRGSRVTGSKLKEADVLEIRSSPLSISKLSSKYGVSPSSISHIRARKSWAWLNETSSPSP